MPANAEDTRAIALADVNGDTLLDLIVINAGTSRVHLNLGKATPAGAWRGFDATAAATFATPRRAARSPSATSTATASRTS